MGREVGVDEERARRGFGNRKGVSRPRLATKSGANLEHPALGKPADLVYAQDICIY
jgi:hypothetical protein